MNLIRIMPEICRVNETTGAGMLRQIAATKDYHIAGIAELANAIHKHGSKISTRARTYNGERIKVNDKMGNPIEIATVVVWRVVDTAKAVFDVDDYESYVYTVTETALRHVASIYAYDHMEDDDASSSAITLRTNIEEVSEALKVELDRRLGSMDLGRKRRQLFGAPREALVV